MAQKVQKNTEMLIKMIKIEKKKYRKMKLQKKQI